MRIPKPDIAKRFKNQPELASSHSVNIWIRTLTLIVVFGYSLIICELAFMFVASVIIVFIDDAWVRVFVFNIIAAYFLWVLLKVPMYDMSYCLLSLVSCL